MSSSSTDHRVAAPTVARLSAAEVVELRELLIEQRAFRTEQLAELNQPFGRASCWDSDVVATLASGARSALHDVQAALWRMADGSYGECIGCGGAVERERLEVLPQVARCLRCHREIAARPGVD